MLSDNHFESDVLNLTYAPKGITSNLAVKTDPRKKDSNKKHFIFKKYYFFMARNFEGDV